jgi:hypothetical protein
MVRLDPAASEWRLVEGEIVALDVRHEEYFVVNGSGATLWPLLAAGTTPEELVAALERQFAVSADQAQADVDAFLAKLSARGILAG